MSNTRGFNIPSFWRTIEDERDPEAKDPIRMPHVIGPDTEIIIAEGVRNSIVIVGKGSSVEIKKGATRSIFALLEGASVSGSNGCKVVEVKSLNDATAMIAGFKAQIEAEMAEAESHTPAV
jgi:hypothetical protein